MNQFLFIKRFQQVREKTDALDAAGNTTAAVGKGFAIGSAALVSLALYGAFVTRLSEGSGSTMTGGVNILQPLTFSFLVIGAMLPYWCVWRDGKRYTARFMYMHESFFFVVRAH